MKGALFIALAQSQEIIVCRNKDTVKTAVFFLFPKVKYVEGRE